MIKILFVKELLFAKEHILYLLYKLFSKICHILADKHHETYMKIYKIYESEKEHD